MKTDRDVNLVQTETLSAVATKKRGHKDVFLLVLLVFVVVACLATFTVMRHRSLEVLDAIQSAQPDVDYGGSASSVNAGAGIVEPVSIPETIVEEKTPAESCDVQYDALGLYDNFEKYYYEGDKYVIEYKDGSKYVDDAANHKIITVELTLDDFGIPEDSARAQNAATLLMADPKAYAASSGSWGFGATQCYAANTNYTSSSYSVSNSCSCGSNSSASASCSMTIYLSGTLTTIKSRVGLSVTQNGSGSKSSNGNEYYWSSSCSCSAGCDQSSSASCSADGSLTVSHSYSTQPGIENSTGFSWTSGKAFTFKATDSKLYVRYLAATYTNTTSGGTTTASWTGDSTAPTVTTGTNYGAVTVSSYTWNGSTKSTSYSAQTLGIDAGSPVINYFFCATGNSSTTEQTSQTAAGTLYFFVQCYDTRNYSCAASSGINYVYLTNSTTGKNYGGSQSVFSSAASGNGSATNKWFAVSGADANGSWTVTVKDQRGFSVSKSYTFSRYDGNKPTVDSVKVEANSGTKFTESGVNWTNEALKVSFKVYDTACSYQVANCGISSATLSYKVNGVSKSHSTTSFSVSTSGVTKSATVTFAPITYDYNTMTDFTITVKDPTGNTGTYTYSGTSNVSVTGRLDTVAPIVNKLQPSAGVSGYTAAAVKLTYNTLDYDVGDVGEYYGVSGKKYNNGSGIWKLAFFADAAKTIPLPVNGTTSNEYVVESAKNKTGAHSKAITLNVDSTRFTFNSATKEFRGNVYVVAYDWCGNRSDGAAIPTVTNVSATADAQRVDDASLSTYYKNTIKGNKLWLYPGISYKKDGVEETAYDKSYYNGIQRDVYKPQVVVSSANGVGGTVWANTAGKSGTTKAYTTQWYKQGSLTFYARVYYGASGGKFYAKNGTADVQTYSAISAYVKNTDASSWNPITVGSTQGTAEYYASMSTAGDTSLSAWKYADYSVTVAKTGTYTLYFTNGAGKDSEKLNITVRLDNTAPTISLLGFNKTGGTAISTEADVQALLNESVLLNASSWIYPASNDGFRFVFQIEDNEGGVGIPTASGETRAYGPSGSGSTQVTSSYARSWEQIDGTSGSQMAGCYLETRYSQSNSSTDAALSKKAYSWPYVLTGGARTISSVDLYSRNLLSDLKVTGTSYYDVVKDTYIRYKFAAADFLGNVGYYAFGSDKTDDLPNYSASNVQWNNRVIRYKVDPFAVVAGDVTAWVLKSEDTVINGDNIATYVDAGISKIADSYVPSLSRDGGWTKKTVIFQQEVHSGLSGFKATSKWFDLTSVYATKTSLASADIRSWGNLPNTLATTKVLTSGTTVWVLYDANESKNVQVGIGIESNAYKSDTLNASFGVTSSSSHTGDNATYASLGSSSVAMIVKQDRDVPIIEAIFLSEKDTYEQASTTANRLLTFDASHDASNNYTFTLNTSLSPRYNSMREYSRTESNEVKTYHYIYNSTKVYVYAQVTDQVGALLGSDIASMKFGSETAISSPSGRSGNVRFFRSTNTYGFEKLSLTGISAIGLTLKDKTGNETSTSLATTVSGGVYTLPVVDPISMYVRMGSTNQAQYLETASSPDSGMLDFPTTTSTAQKPSYRLKGTAISSDSFVVSIQCSVGISGLKLYVRRKNATDLSRDTATFTYFAPDNQMSNDYDYAGAGWGRFEGENWVPGGFYEISFSDNVDATGRQVEQTQNVTFALKSFKERLEVLAVSGTGKYYIIDLGLLFIDNEPPVIHEHSTFFSVESASDTKDSNGAVDYTKLQKIWTNVVGTDYTNGDVYIYYLVTDAASGVNDDLVKYGDQELDAVIVKSVPVWYVGSVATTARRISDTTPTKKASSTGALLFSDPATGKEYAVYKLPSDTGNPEAIMYSGSGTVTKGTANVKMYRLKVQSKTDYSITATDTVKKKSPATNALTPAIDKTAVSIDLKGRTDDSDTNWTGYTGTSYTNKQVSLRWKTTFGPSGFGGLHYQKVVNNAGLNQSDMTLDLVIPQINKIDGKIAITFIPANATSATTNSTYSWPSGGFTLKVEEEAQVAGWYVSWKSGNTTVRRNIGTYNATVYGDKTEMMKYEWEVKESEINCIFTLSAQNRDETYTVTGYNAVKTEYAKNNTRPSQTKSFSVKMDVVAPVINVNSGNLPELAKITATTDGNNNTVYTVSVKENEWHAVAKALRISVTDSLSGIGESGYWFDAATPVQNVKVGYGYNSAKGSENSEETATQEYYMVRNANYRSKEGSLNDGFYRPYELGQNGSYQKITGLAYLDKNIEYRISAYDKAGNAAYVYFTPQIDTTNATIRDITLLDASGNEYYGGASGVTVGWINAISGVDKIHWTSGPITVRATVNYGASGFYLQYKRATTQAAVEVNSGSNVLAWTTIPSEQLTQVGAVVNESDGTHTAVVEYTISPESGWLYYYYRFRAISAAQYTELYTYKTFDTGNPTNARATDGGVAIYVEREAAEADDFKAKDATFNGRTVVTLSDLMDTDIIAIDTVVPTISFSLQKQNASSQAWSDMGAKINSTDWKVDDGIWSNTNARMALTLTSGTDFASGNVIYVRYLTNEKNATWSAWTMYNAQNDTYYEKSGNIWVSKGQIGNGIVKTLSTDTNATTGYARVKQFVNTLTSSQNNVLYEYYTETGAGLTSNVIRIGTQEGSKRYGIKVDVNQATLTPSAASTQTTYAANTSIASIISSESTQTALKSEYNRTFSTGSYVVDSNATYTYKNTVVINVMISNVGYSGVKLYVTKSNGAKTLVDTITYDAYMEENNGSAISRYYYINDAGETRTTISATSVAGTEAVAQDAYVRIDNTTPIVYVKSITGDRASNWGWTNNLYNENAEYWYISSLKVTLGVGVVKNGAFVNATPYSGYDIYYSADNGTTWIQVGIDDENNDCLTIDGLVAPVNGESYKFKITSKAGLSYLLGGDVLNNASLVDNQRGVIYDADGSDPSKKSGATLHSEISATGTTPIRAHVVGTDPSDGKEKGNFDDASYRFVFYVDSTTYYYSYSAGIDLGNDKTDVNTTKLTTYTVGTATGVSGSDFIFETNGKTDFHRGDVIRIQYAAKYDNVTSTSPADTFNYFQSYTVSTAGSRTVYHTIANNMSGLFDGVATDVAYERNGSVYVQFEGSNINVSSKFLAEVDVTYGVTSFYNQTAEGDSLTTGTAQYAYYDNKTRKTVDVGLRYAYYRYNDTFTAGTATENAELLGAYYVITSVESGFFRVTQATEKQDFVVKYFAATATDNLFYVNDEEDFTHVDETYYDMTVSGGKRVVDHTAKTYLTADFELNNDIDVGSFTLTGTYAGTFNGLNHTVTMDGKTITGDHGLFDVISGTVKSLTLKAGKIIISATNTADIGLLAKEITGAVDGVAVLADVRIDRMASGSVFGGITAVATGAEIGQNKTSFTDVRITNNGAALDNVAVSVVAGYATVNTTSFADLFAFGEIELYNVTNVRAGILYGGTSGAGSFVVADVAFFNNNVFVNGSTVGGASNVAATLNGTANPQADYDTFAGLMSNNQPLTAGGTEISTEILARLYADFGYVYDGLYTYGKGTTTEPLEISTLAQIKAIGGYMNLNFVITEEVISMASFDNSLAITKVFNGSLSAADGLTYVRFTDFNENVATYDKPMMGLFGQLNGTVQDIVFDSIDLNVNYVGTDDAYIGIVAAKAYENAVVSNVMMIGTTKVTATGKAVVGGVVGSADGTTFSDIFNVNNIAVTAGQVYLGGIAGEANDITLPETAGAIFLLGRTEAVGAMLTSGSVVGKITGTVTGGTRTFTIEDNVYVGGTVLSVPYGNTDVVGSVRTVSFSDDGMRTASFASVSGSAFDVAFEYYPLEGTGSDSDPFIVSDEDDFRNINLILYANYRVDADITFTDFATIGEGLVFSGVLKGYVGEDISAENGKVISLINVTGPLVYYNAGSISELSVNVIYSATVASGETFRYGAIAIYNEGEIKNVTVAGTVSITSLANDTTLYVSGFVAESFGGKVEGDVSKLQNSISALDITVTGGGTAYVGGYAGSVTRGAASFSYGIATGTITITGVKTTYAGLLVGRSTGECTWILGEAASIDYTYTVTVDGNEIPKYDGEGEPLEENFCGLAFISE